MINEMVPRMHKNNGTAPESTGMSSLFRAPPLKHYRREIPMTVVADNEDLHCSRSAYSIHSVFEIPGGTLVNSAHDGGLVNTLDITRTENRTERPPADLSQENCVTSVSNAARRRCRSAGMITRQTGGLPNQNSYCTDSRQYLASRSRTFGQNQFNNLRIGNAQVKPGDSLSSQNVYATNTLSSCPGPIFVMPSVFKYVWIDQTFHSVSIPADPTRQWTLEELNQLLQSTMLINKHYFTETNTGARVFLLNMAYNTFNNDIELQVTDPAPYNAGVLTNIYSLPPLAAWSGVNTPKFQILANQMQSVLGFTDGLYPSAQSPITGNAVSRSNRHFNIISRNAYVPVTYKPNNSQFATQGAVSSSARLARLKYDNVTSVGGSFRTAYGPQTANALAYNAAPSGYTIKDKIGFPSKCTPVVSKYGIILSRCVNKLALTHTN